ncbi:MAG: carbohydrate binding domain-containing protein [Pirellulales bacterium]|nr:carbohydrate binding domain-containing protein [Pirellulales bacterium]
MLGFALIVSAVAMAGLYELRLKRRLASDYQEINQARWIAMSGLELVLQRIEANANWRSQLAANSWNTPVPLAGGTYAVTATDPLDGNLLDDDLEPVVMTVTGVFGAATQRVSRQLESRRLPYDAIQAGIASQQEMRLNLSTVTGGSWVLSNSKVILEGTTQLRANAVAPLLQGIGYQLLKRTNGRWPRYFPQADDQEPDYALAYYLANGTEINYADLPIGEVEMLANPTFETDISGWTTYGTATLAHSTTQAASGAASILVSGRANSSSGLAQSVVTQVESNGSYDLSTAIRVAQNSQVQLALYIETTTGNQTLASSSQTCVAGIWRTLTHSVTPTWTGTLLKAEWRIITNNTSDYHVDNASLVDLNIDAQSAFINKKILSAGSNPFSGTTNPQGIYVIDCQGQKLIIKNSRIAATLVLLNPNPVTLCNSIHWQPGVENYPALLVVGYVNINTSAAPLSEGSLAINFNPLGAPYQGTWDSLMDYSYTSEIQGLVYATGNIIFKGQSTIRGAVVSNQQIDFFSSTVNLIHASKLLTNPPPGFYHPSPNRFYTPGSLKLP